MSSQWNISRCRVAATGDGQAADRHCLSPLLFLCSACCLVCRFVIWYFTSHFELWGQITSIPEDCTGTATTPVLSYLTLVLSHDREITTYLIKETVISDFCHLWLNLIVTCTMYQTLKWSWIIKKKKILCQIMNEVISKYRQTWKQRREVWPDVTQSFYGLLLKFGLETVKLKWPIIPKTIP